MSIRIAPSLMCSDFRRLKAELDLFASRGVEMVHLDIMDGHFVPNITMGPPLVRAIGAMTDLTLDIHLMLDEPERFIPAMAEAGRAPFISVHAESHRPLAGLVRTIRARGARPAVALNPHTPAAVLEPVAREIEMVLLMCVQPGFAGQKLIPGTIEKIGEVKALLARCGASALIEVDGNTTFDNIRRMAGQGADVIVAGSSCLYRAGVPLEAALDELVAFVATM